MTESMQVFVMGEVAVELFQETPTAFLGVWIDVRLPLPYASGQ